MSLACQAALEGKAAKAKARMASAQEKADSVATAPPPKIEVGSFEEVVMRMTQAEGEDLASWSQIMFVASGMLSVPAEQQRLAAVQAAAAQKQLEGSSPGGGASSSGALPTAPGKAAAAAHAAPAKK